ncbi:hypothetical protein GCM10008967_29380 [Bacillus carboniphilus]|uniref:Uncharacterized protein n=1 Tax=Bacillus carboniphilus TaxID=86663 RepID=A0ABN0WGT2_9BACI
MPDPRYVNPLTCRGPGTIFKEYSESNRNDNIITINRGEKQVEEINKLVEKRNLKAIEQLENTIVKEVDGKTFILIEDNSEESSSSIGIMSYTKDVPPDPNDPNYQRKNAQRKLSRLGVYSSALDARGYDPYTDIRVYETMDYYTEVSKGYKYFSAGTAVNTVAIFWDVAKSSALTWITAAAVVVDVYDKIQGSINAIDAAQYDFQGGKEGTVYDPTNYNRDVETWSTWERGRVALGWSYSGGYQDPHWTHIDKSTALEMSNYTVSDNALNTYNNNINVYGYWKHGVGQLGY